MSQAQIIAFLPIMATTAVGLIVMLLVAVKRSHTSVFIATIVGLGLSFLTIFIALPLAPQQVTALIVIDRFSLFYFGLIIASTLAIAFLSHGYLIRRPVRKEEYYILLVFAAVGGEVLAAASHYASFFLGLEILGISLYGMIAYERDSLVGIEAGVKYLILAAVSSAFILFGMAMIYLETGSLEFSTLFARPGSAFSTLSLIGFGMITVGVGFKLAVVPFHLWTPDVYQGAPAPVTAFVATVSKGAMFALLVRYFVELDLYRFSSVFLVFSVIAGLSILVGNILALLQNNVKRVLAYSSIAHLGYLLVALLASGSRGVSAVNFYLVAYFITNIGAFGVVAYLSEREKEAEMIEDYHGLAWRRPWLAGVFTAMLLSLAGIPLTVGFIGKFFIIAAGAGARLWTLLFVLVAGSIISFFYYLRIMIAMFREREGAAPPARASFSLPGGVALSVLTLLLVWLGVYPTPLVAMIQRVTAVLF